MEANLLRARLARCLPAALIVLLLAGTSAAQEPPRTFGDIPVRVSGPPPAWIEPGLRLTYHTLVGTLASGPAEYTVDPKGRWVDSSGQRYRRKQVEAQGSHGYMQARVAAMGKDEVAVQMLFFLFDGLDAAAPVQNLETGYLAPASTGGDLWLHPDALKQLLEKGATGLEVTRIEHEIELATYDAVLIHGPRPEGRSVWIYDLQSGVLLYSSDVTRLDGTRTRAGVQQPVGSAHVRFTSFKASRTVPVPWGERPLPAAIASARGLDYDCRFVVRQPGMVETPLPFEVQLDIGRRGPDWALLQAKASGGPPIPGLDARVSGNHLLCGMWIPPDGIGALRAGQELDRDPLTHFVTRVAQVDEHSVVVVQEGPRQVIEMTYRRSDGLLARVVAQERIVSVPGMSKVIEMELAGTR